MLHIRRFRFGRCSKRFEVQHGKTNILQCRHSTYLPSNRRSLVTTLFGLLHDPYCPADLVAFLKYIARRFRIIRDVGTTTCQASYTFRQQSVHISKLRAHRSATICAHGSVETEIRGPKVHRVAGISPVITQSSNANMLNGRYR